MKNLLFTLLMFIPFGLFSQTNVIEPELHSNVGITYRDSTFNFIEHNGLVYTIADDGIHGLELWVFDDEQNSLRMVKDININGDSNPFVVSNGLEDILLFYAYDDKGYGLWKTDGSEKGTRLIKYFNPRSNNANVLRPKEKGKNILNGEYYFTASEVGFTNIELWKTDGTENGTKLVKDINNGGSSNPSNFHIVGDKLIFRTSDSNNDIWSTDGTEENTFRVSSGNMEKHNSFSYWGCNSSHCFFLDSIDGKVELLSTDGTKEGTLSLSNKFEGLVIEQRDIIFIGDYLYFYGLQNDNNLILCVSDGTVLGTKQVKMFPQVQYPYIRFFSFYNSLKQVLFFEMYVDNKNSLWVTDGTESGTNDISPPEFVNVLRFKESPTTDKLYFTSRTESYREDLWVSDGTSLGTHFVNKLVEGNDKSRFEFTSEIIDDKLLYFYKDETGVASTWVTDGTGEGTSILNPNLTNLTRMYHSDNQYNNILFFTEISEADSVRMWQTNMTKVGTSIIMPKDQSNNNHVRPHQFYQIEYNNHIYFFADYYGEGQQLYRIPNTITSVEDTPKQELMTLYPNPAKDYIQLELDKPMQLSIVNSTGSKVKDYDMVVSGKLNVAGLSTGVYFVVDELGKNIAKFVKE